LKKTSEQKIVELIRDLKFTNWFWKKKKFLSFYI
jgi:hypothetical protein